MRTIGVADTTFARVDMGRIARAALAGLDERLRIVRRTVPGIKDLPVASLKLFREADADLVIALGMPGKAEYDRTCAHEASQGLIRTGVQEGRPVVEVFVFEGEATNDKELAFLARQRTEEHALNAYRMLFLPEVLTKMAGSGARQGFPDAGPAGAPHKRKRYGNAIAKYA